MKSFLNWLWSLFFGIKTMQKEGPVQMIQCTDKIVIVYEDKVELETKLREGTMYFQNHSIKILSGGFGNGFAEKADYRGYSLLNETREAFTMFGLGWQVPLRNVTKGIERGYAIHPDGNVPGSKGCFVAQFQSLEENVLWRNLIRNWLDNHGSINVQVV